MALTKHKEGSIRELWAIALPLMLTSFSFLAMIFVDRFFLAHYSQDAFNAVVNASTLGWAFVLAGLTLGSISEVFVAQYNGSKKWEKIGEPVWQMIWAGIFSLAFYLPLAFWGTDYIYGQSAEYAFESTYFRWMIAFAPSAPIFGALTGFFVGRGQTIIVTMIAFATNIVNGVLDAVLIFGVDGWVPELGVQGAAISTSIGSIFQMFVLLAIFLRKSNHERYRTRNWHLNLSALKRCLKIGVPGALFSCLEMLGWAAYYWMLTLSNKDNITIAGIGQSFVILLFFFSDGISKAATAIAGNFIGAGRHWNIRQLLQAGFSLHLMFFLFMGAFLGLFHDLIIASFLPNLDAAAVERLRDPLMTTLMCLLIYLFLEGVRFLYSGILTAAGDTFFLLIAGAVLIWCCLIVPVYVAVFYFNMGVVAATLISVGYSLVGCLAYIYRFRSGHWKSIKIHS